MAGGGGRDPFLAILLPPLPLPYRTPSVIANYFNSRSSITLVLVSASRGVRTRLPASERKSEVLPAGEGLHRVYTTLIPPPRVHDIKWPKEVLEGARGMKKRAAGMRIPHSPVFHKGAVLPFCLFVCLSFSLSFPLFLAVTSSFFHHFPQAPSGNYVYVMRLAIASKRTHSRQREFLVKSSSLRPRPEFFRFSREACDL